MNTQNIDELLASQLHGCVIQHDLSTSYSGLPANHQFSWERIMQDPKGDHGSVECRANWYKTMKYEILHSGGFLRLFTLRGRAYWNAQNETEHTTPDWKLHFSCDLDHIGQAWNSLAALFMDMKCEIGMKVTVLNNEQWSDSQRGREITVYIYSYHHSYRGYMQGVIPEYDHDLYMGHELSTVYHTPFWFSFIREAEIRLKAIGAQSRGVADGDLALPGCGYASLRNEAFIRVTVQPAVHVEESRISSERQTGEAESASKDDSREGEVSTEDITGSPVLRTPVMPLQYPPNECGWNAACHPNPVLEVIYFLQETHVLKQRVEILENLLSR